MVDDCEVLPHACLQLILLAQAMPSTIPPVLSHSQRKKAEKKEKKIADLKLMRKANIMKGGLPGGFFTTIARDVKEAKRKRKEILNTKSMTAEVKGFLNYVVKGIKVATLAEISFSSVTQLKQVR